MDSQVKLKTPVRMPPKAHSSVRSLSLENFIWWRDCPCMNMNSPKPMSIQLKIRKVGVTFGPGTMLWNHRFAIPSLAGLVYRQAREDSELRVVSAERGADDGSSTQVTKGGGGGDPLLISGIDP